VGSLRPFNPVASVMLSISFAGVIAALTGYLVILMGVFYCMFTRGYEKWDAFLDPLALFVALPVALIIFGLLLRRAYRWCRTPGGRPLKV
jgi:hypothetical protein